MKKRILAKRRKTTPHASLYADTSVLLNMRELAAARGVKVNDVMLAGLFVVFKQNDLPDIEDINTEILNRIFPERNRLIHEGVGDTVSTPKTEKEFAA